jgi:inhibitor of KinA sporulation pathway (predicted exonuclease)
MPTLNLAFDAPLQEWPKTGLISILDLEYTAWEGSAQRGWVEPWEWREIIQIGMVLVDAKTFLIKEGFEILVRPEKNEILSDYFIELTGISQKRIEEEAVSFKQALKVVTPIGLKAECIMFNGYDGQILRENCVFHNLSAPWEDSHMFNFRPLLADTLNRPQGDLTSSDLPALAGVKIDGQPHSALHDCNSIAFSFGAWRRAGLI